MLKLYIRVGLQTYLAHILIFDLHLIIFHLIYFPKGFLSIFGSFVLMIWSKWYFCFQNIVLKYTQARATNYYLPSMHTPHFFLDISIQWLPYFLLCSISAPKNVVQLFNVQMINFPWLIHPYNFHTLCPWHLPPSV